MNSLRPSAQRTMAELESVTEPLLAHERSTETMARSGSDTGRLYTALAHEFGEPVADRVEAPATPRQKQRLAALAPQRVQATELAGERIAGILGNGPGNAPGNGAAIGGIELRSENGWLAAQPSGTEDIYEICAESFLGAGHLQRLLAQAQTLVGRAIASPAAPRHARD